VDFGVLLRLHQAAASLTPNGVSNVGGMLKLSAIFVTFGDKVTAGVLYFCGRRAPPTLGVAAA
jgi:hypothetical protein